MKLRLYTTERIVNIADLEKQIFNCLALANRIKEANPQDDKVKRLVDSLESINSFEFVIERRMTVIPKKSIQGLFSAGCKRS